MCVCMCVYFGGWGSGGGVKVDTKRRVREPCLVCRKIGGNGLYTLNLKVLLFSLFWGLREIVYLLSKY